MSKIGWSNFVVWQCSIRQRNFRMFSGKPSEGIVANLSEIKSNKSNFITKWERDNTLDC